MEAFWDGPHTMPPHRSLLIAFSTPGAPVYRLMELPLGRRGRLPGPFKDLSRRLSEVIE
jgi:hypothetical protein